MTISVNAAPNVTDTTVSGNVAAGTSSGDVHDIVADSDDADSVLVVTGVAAGNESSNNTIITNNTGVGSAVTGTYGSLTSLLMEPILTQQMQQIILLLQLQQTHLHLLHVMMKRTQAHLLTMLVL